MPPSRDPALDPDVDPTSLGDEEWAALLDPVEHYRDAAIQLPLAAAAADAPSHLRRACVRPQATSMTSRVTSNAADAAAASRYSQRTAGKMRWTQARAHSAALGRGGQRASQSPCRPRRCRRHSSRLTPRWPA